MSFRPFGDGSGVITGAAVPLLLPNVDTDVIIRVDRMTSREPAVLGPWAFETFRHHADGAPDPECMLNQPLYLDAPILIAGENFGCGSSREPAVWALQGLGIRAIIAPSYGDIFAANCQQNGVLAVVLEEPEVAQLATHARAGEWLTVDLRHQQISLGAAFWTFAIPALARQSLLEGLDDLELALRET